MAFFGTQRVTTYLLHHEPVSYVDVARLSRQVEPKRKRVLTGRASRIGVDPKPERSTHVQVEGWVTPPGGPNPLELKIQGMRCG